MLLYRVRHFFAPEHVQSSRKPFPKYISKRVSKFVSFILEIINSKIVTIHRIGYVQQRKKNDLWMCTIEKI